MIFDRLKQRDGFTLVELLIFTVVFSVVSIAFVGIFIVVTKIQSRENSAVAVNQESQFLLQTIQRLVQESSLIEMNADQSTTSIKLRMASNINDPTYIYVLNGQAFLKETDAGVPEALTSNRVSISTSSFVKRNNPGGKDTINVAFTMTAKASNTLQAFTQALNTSVARVSAATFDSDIRASTTNSYKIGANTDEWQSINNTIFFSGNKVGINFDPGAETPANSLGINGALHFNSIATSTCNAANRGNIFFVQNGMNKDLLVICAVSSSAYYWQPLN